MPLMGNYFDGGVLLNLTYVGQDLNKTFLDNSTEADQDQKLQDHLAGALLFTSPFIFFRCAHFVLIFSKSLF